MAAIRQQWARLSLARPALAQTLLLQMLPGIGARMLHPRHSAVCAAALPVAAMLMSGNDDYGRSGPPPSDWYASQYPSDQPHLAPGQLPPQNWADPEQFGQPMPALNPRPERGWWQFGIFDSCCNRRGRRPRSSNSCWDCCDCCDCCYCCECGSGVDNHAGSCCAACDCCDWCGCCDCNC
jgi:hypothetical protein